MKIKTKGEFASSGPGLPGASGQKKNPNMDICTDAVVAYLKDGTPIEETIEWCTDPRRFLVVRRVTGGAMKDDDKIGKALRWYYSKDVQGGFVYAKNGNAVPESIGARLMMELVDRVPADLDFDYYIREAYAILTPRTCTTSRRRPGLRCAARLVTAFGTRGLSMTRCLTGIVCVRSAGRRVSCEGLADPARRLPR